MTDLQARAEAAADAVRGDSPRVRGAPLWCLARDAALHALQSEGWRPIGEAPRDGHWLGWNADDSCWQVWAAKTYWACYDGTSSPPVMTVLEAEGTTHFMPMPAPPEGEG